MRALRLMALTIIAAAAIVGPLVSAGDAVFAAPDSPVLCHATDSVKNPYNAVKINNPDSVTRHQGHTGPIFEPGMTSGWGDIIPAVDAFPGLNTDAFGQAILEHGCVYPTDDPTGYITPIVTCMRYDAPQDVYQVLYSYRNSTPITLSVAQGSQNSVLPSNMAQYAATEFSPGFVLQGFAVTVPKGTSAPTDTLSSWTLLGQTASFVPASTAACGPDVVVPADGNGAGWAIVALVSVTVIGVPLILVLRRAGHA